MAIFGRRERGKCTDVHLLGLCYVVAFKENSPSRCQELIQLQRIFELASLTHGEILRSKLKYAQKADDHART